MVFRKEHNVVVMDGTNEHILIDIMMNVAERKSSVDPLVIDSIDKAHPSIYVVKFMMNWKNLKKLRAYCDRMYPGLCCYDVAV